MVGRKERGQREKVFFIYDSPQGSYYGIIAFITVPTIIERRWKNKMVSEGIGRLFRRKDDKYLIYLPLCLAKGSMFPFKDASVFVKVSFKPSGAKRLVIEKWKKAEKTP